MTKQYAVGTSVRRFKLHLLRDRKKFESFLFILTLAGEQIYLPLNNNMLLEKGREVSVQGSRYMKGVILLANSSALSLQENPLPSYPC